jgi:hypothetical protein
VEEDKSEVVESEHPYPNNVEKKWKLDFPGAKQIEITFDEQTRTDYNNDFLRFCKDDKLTEWWGEEKYHGRDRQQNWPGLQSRPPLIIPASSCVVFFKSDYETNDWGFRFTARAHTVTVVAPPERPPLRNYMALLQLYLQGLKALASIIENVPDFVKPASGAITNLLVKAALKTPELTGEYVRKAEPLWFETKHPYDCNEERYETVCIPGAKKLTCIFDPKTASERGCDYLRFYKDDSRGEFWGENQFTGGKDGSSQNWPGVQGNPPLEIPADHFVIYWHTDGSVVDWGWKLKVIPDFGKGDGMATMSTAEVTMRAFYLNEYLYDRPRAQEVPRDLASFEVQPPHRDSDGPLPIGDAGDVGLEEIVLEDGPGPKAAGGVQASAVGRKMGVNFRDAETVQIRAEPRSDATSVATLTAEQTVMVLEEQRDWLKVQREGVEGWVLRREGDLVSDGFAVATDQTTDMGEAQERM